MPRSSRSQAMVVAGLFLALISVSLACLGTARSEGDDIVRVPIEDAYCLMLLEDPACGGDPYQCWDVQGGSCPEGGTYRSQQYVPVSHPACFPVTGLTCYMLARETSQGYIWLKQVCGYLVSYELKRCKGRVVCSDPIEGGVCDYEPVTSRAGEGS